MKPKFIENYKYDRAKDLIMRIKTEATNEREVDRRKAFDLAISSLEKQIPKKPLHMHKNFYCPVCKEDGWLLWDDAEPNDFDSYCCKCGQALDWS